MKSDLDELIAFYESERKALEHSIKENIKELEYLNAHIQSKALLNIDRKLARLNKFKDPFFDKRKEIERTIEMYEAFNENESPYYIDSYYDKRIKEEKEKLQNLSKQIKLPFYDDQKIDDALFSLLKGEHDGFILYLNVNDNLSFNFQMISTDTLEISISLKSVLNADYFFGDDEEEENPTNKFKGLGFILNNQGNRLVYRCKTNDYKDASFIKILLSRIVYDVFAFTELDDPASLIYF